MFSAGKTLIRHENTADLVLRPTNGGVRPGVAADLRWTRKGRAACDSIYASSKDFLSLRYHERSLFGRHTSYFAGLNFAV
jgi:hypothetical protein